MRNSSHRGFCCGGAGLLLVLAGSLAAGAQLQIPAATAGQTQTASAIDPEYRADAQPLLDADRRFAAEVLRGGGAVFATWFADDAVTLTSGKAAVMGRAAIAHETTWKPEEYQLIWAPDGARMGPSGDSGVTWGNYQGRARDHQGNPIVQSGRYITVWRREKSGQWKVVLDGSNDAPPEAGDCCRVK